MENFTPQKKKVEHFRSPCIQIGMVVKIVCVVEIVICAIGLVVSAIAILTS